MLESYSCVTLLSVKPVKSCSPHSRLQYIYGRSVYAAMIGVLFRDIGVFI